MDRIFEAIEEWADTAGLEWEHFQHDTKSFRFGHCTDCRYDYYLCALL